MQVGLRGQGKCRSAETGSSQYGYTKGVRFIEE